MSNVTDPARELGEIAERLTKSEGSRGDRFLASQFKVKAWSTSFVKILACILERADIVATSISRSQMMDEDHKANALNDLEKFKAGFAGDSLLQGRNSSEGGLPAMKDHGRSLQYLSPIVRLEISYPQLDVDEVSELVGLVDSYLAELQNTHDGPAFVRQAIIDGLTAFRFQLEHVGWMGAGYSLSAFREVMHIYDVSKRQYSDLPNFDADAALKGLWIILNKFKEKLDAAKGWKDSGEAVWKLYQIGSSVATPLLLTGVIPRLMGPS